MWKYFSQKSTDPAIYIKVDIFDDDKTLKTERSKDSSVVEDRLYRISATNYVKLWTGVYEADGIINIMLESNEDVETEDKEGFLHAGLRMLHNPQLVEMKLFTELPNGNLQIKLIRVNQIVLKMCFILKLSTAEEFFYSVTRPLLVIVDDQMQSEYKLRQLLLNKDAEMQGFLEMLSQCNPLMRCLRTQQYNDEEHLNNHRALTELIGTYDQQGVRPKRILNGMPVSNKRVYPDLSSEIDINKFLPVHSVGAEEIGSKFKPTGIKTYTSYQSSAIKTEPNNTQTEPNHETNEPNDGTNELSGPNDTTSKPNSCTTSPDNKAIASESDTKTQTQTDVTNIISSLPPAIPDTLQPITAPTDVTDQSSDVDPKPIDQDTQNPRVDSPSKKRRKNELNY